MRQAAGWLLIVAAMVLGWLWFSSPGAEAPSPKPIAPVIAVPKPPSATAPIVEPAPAEAPPVVEAAPAVPVVAEGKPAVLLVRNGETRAPEPRAQAWRVFQVDLDGAFLAPAQPAEHALPADDGGRIPLPTGSAHAYFAVRSPGSAWALVHVPVEGGEIPVDLVPGGTVRLVIENWGDLEEARIYSGPGLRARDLIVDEEDGEADEGARSFHHEQPLREPVPAPVTEGTILLEGVPCGPRGFEVRRGEWWDDGDIYGGASTGVVAGETVEVRVPTVPVKAGTRAPLEFALTFAEEWRTVLGEENPSLSLQGAQPSNAPVRESIALDKPFEKATRRTPPVPPGRYTAGIDSIGWKMEFTVPEGGGRFEWAVPPPMLLRVRLLDGNTGKPVVGGTLSAREVDTNAWLRVEGAVEGEFLARLVPGKWLISAEAPGYQDGEFTFETTGGGEVRRTLNLRPAARIAVHLRCDGQPWKGSGWVDVTKQFDDGDIDREMAEKEPDEDGGVLSGKGTSVSDGECSFDGITPGRWVAKVKPMPGFEDAAEKEIVVVRGGVYEVVFDLVRTK